ncbi:hypothetical protein LCGC14_2639800 [marine sediment metagenome]|uniref:Uncharacterized protein n=1 Tax=marine sediment metagenome TaxID=412755 RepID=A0A0F9AKA7_9ZZZZ
MEKDRRDREELDSIKSLVNKLDDIMTRMGDPAVTKIFEILAEYLPKMSDKESSGDFGLGSSNSWG